MGPSRRTARPGPGNGWRQTNSSSSPASADDPNLVLEEQPQGLHQLEVHALRQAADVVMALDGLRRADDRHAFDHVRVQRALRQEVEPPELERPPLKHVDERPADDLALAFGIGHPAS
jgi:hypothetical protein